MPEATASDGAIGILGGTFDPVHSAHLALAARARAVLPLDRVIWVPAGQPWHRQPPQCGAAQRLAMVRLAIAGHEGFEVDDSEVLSAAPGYTVLSLQRLRDRLGPTCPLVLLLGADAWLGLHTWHRWREIFSLAHVAIATRPGFALDAAAMPAELAQEFETRQSEVFATPAGALRSFSLVAGTVSATETRARLAAGQDPGDWLPPGILGYIRAHQLYVH